MAKIEAGKVYGAYRVVKPLGWKMFGDRSRPAFSAICEHCGHHFVEGLSSATLISSAKNKRARCSKCKKRNGGKGTANVDAMHAVGDKAGRECAALMRAWKPTSGSSDKRFQW